LAKALDRVEIRRVGRQVEEALRIEYVSADTLRPDPNNARTHSRKQVKQIAKSIQEFGFVNGILVDDSF
jgi:ParB-like chromosome segregation protein Spo0J